MILGWYNFQITVVIVAPTLVFLFLLSKGPFTRAVGTWCSNTLIISFEAQWRSMLVWGESRDGPRFTTSTRSLFPHCCLALHASRCYLMSHFSLSFVIMNVIPTLFFLFFIHLSIDSTYLFSRLRTDYYLVHFPICSSTCPLPAASQTFYSFTYPHRYTGGKKLKNLV